MHVYTIRTDTHRHRQVKMQKRKVDGYSMAKRAPAIKKNKKNSNPPQKIPHRPAVWLCDCVAVGAYINMYRMSINTRNNSARETRDA